MVRSSLMTALLLCNTALAWADSHGETLSAGLNQNLFKDLTSSLGTAIGYKAINPGGALMTLGYDLSREATGRGAADDGTAYHTDYSLNNLLAPQIQFVQGLPYGMDIGGFYTALPNDNVELFGGELGYALYAGDEYAPSLSIRGTFTRLRGFEDLDLFTRGLELSVSKGFHAFTPYAGFGTLWINGETDSNNLDNETLRAQKYFIGFQLKLGMMNFAAETEQTGDKASTSAKFGVRF